MIKIFSNLILLVILSFGIFVGSSLFLRGQTSTESDEFEKGVETEKTGDYTQALMFYRIAFKKGNGAAANRIGELIGGRHGESKLEGSAKYYQNNKESFKWYQRGANLGNTDAFVNLGYCYEWGHGVDHYNPVEAMKWFQRAANLGNKKGANALGDHYKNVLRDYPKAFEWYKKGDCYFEIGLFYHMGEGVPKDDQEALKWWRKAAAEGDSNSQRCLDELTWNEKKPNDKPGDFELRQAQHELNLPNPDREAAKSWLQKSADRGNPVADFELGNYYLKSGNFPFRFGLNRDYVNAEKYYEMSADGGFNEAEISLWFMLQDFKNQMSSTEISDIVGWLQKKADQGHIDAAYYLARSYEEALGVPQNIELAKKYYEVSEAPNSKYEKELDLIRLEVEGNPITVQGILKGGLAAIGGETTGWRINFDQPVTIGENKVVKWMDVEPKQLSMDMSDKKVCITGVIHWIKGVEIRDRIEVIPRQIRTIDLPASQ